MVSISSHARLSPGAHDAPDDLLTIAEVARWLRVDPTTVRRWIKCGALEAITLPHRGKRQAYRVKRSTMLQLVPP